MPICFKHTCYRTRFFESPISVKYQLDIHFVENLCDHDINFRQNGRTDSESELVKIFEN